MYVIYRAINGISLNGNEFLRDDNGNTRMFSTQQEAFDFLLSACPTYTAETLQDDLDEGIINIGEESEVL